MKELYYIKDLSEQELIKELFKTNLDDYSDDELVIIKKTISDGLQQNKNFNKIADDLSLCGGGIAQNAIKLSKTFVVAFQRITHLQKALIAEIEWYQYVGIVKNKTYTFCLDILNKHHNIDNILKMKNGVLEPVIYFGGGFECTHRWEANPFYTDN